MPTNEPEEARVSARLEALQRRLATLERRNRLAKRIVIGVAGAFACLAVMAQSSQPTIRQTVEARRFVLRDANGRVRANLHLSAKGAPELALYHADGTLATCVGGEMCAACAQKQATEPFARLLPGNVEVGDSAKDSVGLVATKEAAGVLGSSVPD